MSMNLASPLRIPSAPPGDRTEARLRVVPRRQMAPPRMPFVLLVSLVLLGGVIGLLCFNTQMQQASFAATALQQQATNLAAREQTLVRELEQLRNPQRLAEAAQAQGLVIPPTSCTLSLPNGATSDTCAPATADNTPQLQGPAPTKPRVLQAAEAQRAGEAAQSSGQNARHQAQVPGSAPQDR